MKNSKKPEYLLFYLNYVTFIRNIPNQFLWNESLFSAMAHFELDLLLLQPRRLSSACINDPFLTLE
jgi:hypothetical protein